MPIGRYSDVSLALKRGEACALVGPSGSGKTTLLSILGCLLIPTSGSLTIAGQDLEWAQPRRLVELRRLAIGFVFQHSRLLPFLTLKENLRIVARNAGITGAAVDERIAELSHALGIECLLGRTPDKISGGQCQARRSPGP